MMPSFHAEPIRLTLSKPFGEIPGCASRFWGNPDLPRGYGYPEFTDADGDPFEYQFICQINLADIAALDPRGLLPHTGLLSFFAKIDHYLGRFDNGTSLGLSLSSPDDVRVLYFPDAGAPGSNPDFVELVMVDENNNPLNPSELEISFSAAEPQGKDGIYVDDHALLAAPTHREWEDWDEPCAGWQILLQVDSFSGADFNLNFVDFGVLVFLINPYDLAAARFSNVRAQILST